MSARIISRDTYDARFGSAERIRLLTRCLLLEQEIVALKGEQQNERRRVQRYRQRWYGERSRRRKGVPQR